MSGVQWKTAELGSLVMPVKAWSPVKEAPNERLVYVDLSSVDRKTKEIVAPQGMTGAEAPSRARQLLRAGDVLVSTVRPNLNAVAVVPDDLDSATGSTGFCVLRADSQRLDKRYLFHWVRSPAFIASMVRRATGASYPAVSDRIVKQMKIPLPPLPEQRRIAAILDKADAVRRKRQQTLHLADQFLRSAFFDLFGDPVTNPMGWEECPVGNITDCIVPGRDKPKSFTGATPWITTDDLVSLGVTTHSPKGIGLAPEEIEQVRARVIPKGSVIMSCVGDLGISSIAGCDLVVNQQLHTFQCGGRVVAEFLTFFLPFRIPWMRRRSTQTTLPYLNKTNCNSVPVFVPPLDLQRRFAAIVEFVERQKTYQRVHLAKLDALFASLQQRAFRGEL